MLIEVFQRVSPKDIARSLSLNKECYNLFKSSDFQRMYLTKSSSACLVFKSNDCNSIFVVDETMETKYEIRTELDGWQFFGICNGILGFTDFGKNAILLFNPFIRKYKRIENENVLGTTSITFYDILPNSSLLCLRGKRDGDGYQNVMAAVYENNSWRKIKCGVSCLPDLSLSIGINISSRMFRLAKRRVRDPPDCILCFNLEEKNFEVIDIPTTLKGTYGYRLVTLDNFLTLVVWRDWVEEQDICEVWVLTSSWVYFGLLNANYPEGWRFNQLDHIRLAKTKPGSNCFVRTQESLHLLE